MLIREGVLQQSALDPADSYASPAKQYALLALMLAIHERGATLLGNGVPVSRLLELPLLVKARRAKSEYPSDKVADIDAVGSEAQKAFDRLLAEYQGAKESP
jgi:V/A-type H+-transporting ATPase subunit A